MSTFGGKIQEIPQISVDRFDGINLNSEIYFLSHCHVDHMKGLWSNVLQNNLIENNKFLFASEVSCIILKRMFPKIEKQIKELSLYSPTSILVNNKSIGSVTPIPAGHCPGSVMFLFETDIRILYTGDYRINPSDVHKVKSFYDSFNNVKSIYKMYLDTTFFLKSYLKFPKREESLAELCNIIKNWVTQSENHVIKIHTSAKYGYEYVFNEIYKQTNMPVHVNDEMFQFYSLFPEMDKAVTTDDSKTQIHCSCGSSYTNICKTASERTVRTIKTSAFRWQQKDLKNGISAYNESGTYYVCYSTHASYEEGERLLEFLKPQEIVACVEHDDPFTNKLMKKLIEEKLQKIRSVKEVDREEVKLFETRETKWESESDDSSFLNSSQESRKSGCDILDSPPRKKFLEDVNTLD